MTLLTLIVGLLAAPDPQAADPVISEVTRLTQQARDRGAHVGGAVDLMRIGELAQWLPAGDAERRIRAAAEDRKRAPLVRAVGWWLVRHLALRRLDPATAALAVRELGLIDAFVARSGPAPAPTEALQAADWRRLPTHGHGELWLEAYLRPHRETRAAVATRLVSERGGPAVLRLGYDDQATVWLNGDEVYTSAAAHRAWLDQAAVPVVLRPGDNRLVIEVKQRGGAWRLLARVTDAEGTPLPVSAHADPWGAVPEASTDPPPEGLSHLWAALLEAHDREPPVAQDLRDLADYARRTGLPDDDQVVPRVAIEGAWDVEPNARTLRAWLRLLPSDERGAVRAKRRLAADEPAPEDRYAALHLRVLEAWEHYYAGRHRDARDALRQADPLPAAAHLRAVLFEDVGLPNTAARRIEAARARYPNRPRLRRAHISALRTAGRSDELVAELKRMRADGVAGPDDMYQLGLLFAARGQVDPAVESFDAVVAGRPELWTYGLEAADVLLDAGRRAEAVARLEALAAMVPGDRVVAERLARQYVEDGRRDEAIPLLQAAVAASPGESEVRGYLDALTNAPPLLRLGPPVAELAQVASPEGPAAHVLYHHARTDVDEAGLATRRVRRVIRLLTDEGARRYGTVELVYVPGAQRLEIHTARLLREGHAPASPSISDRDLSEPEYRLYYDLRAEVLTFARPRAGDIVEVEWRVADTDPDPAFPGYYGELAYLQESAPRALSVVEYSGPERLRAEVVAHGLPVEHAGGRVTMRDVPPISGERDMPGLSSLRAYVHLSTAADWHEVRDRYTTLLDGRDAPTDALADLAKRWSAGATDPKEILGRLYTELAARTRYVGLEFGVHSFKPELPAVTLARGYGDCKDKATLLIALARAMGVDAKLTLVRTRPSGAITTRPASLAVFDHAIVYAPSLDRFLDPTVDRNDPWTLPPQDQGGTAFVIGVDDAPRPIPAQPADHNRSLWKLDIALAADGQAVGTARWETRGHPATVARRALEADGARRELAERSLAREFPGARLVDPTFQGLSPAADPVVLEGGVQLPAFAARDGGYDVALAPWNLVRRYAQQAERRTPLQLQLRSIRGVQVSAALPKGFEARIPKPVEGASEFGTWLVEAREAPGGVELRGMLTVDTHEVAPDAYPRFRTWLSEFDRALQRPIEVRRE